MEKEKIILSALTDKLDSTASLVDDAYTNEETGDKGRLYTCPVCGHDTLISYGTTWHCGVCQKGGSLDDYKTFLKSDILSKSLSHRMSAFWNNITDQVATPAVPTGFSDLDSVLDDGLYPGLYIVGGISSVGKTAICLQIADQVAKYAALDRGDVHVLVFSLEMSSNELIARSVSRVTYENKLADNSKNAASARDITAAHRWEKFGKGKTEDIVTAANKYQAEAGNNIYVYEGVGDISVTEIRETIKRHIEAEAHPVVFIDYLQCIAPYIDPKHPNRVLTDKQSIDKTITELRRIGRDYNVPVIVISSLNRESYKAGSASQGVVSMNDFKESGGIEYGADVLLGLQFTAALDALASGSKDYDEKAEREKIERRVSLTVLKNRNGVSGSRIDFTYVPKYNYFREVAEQVPFNRTDADTDKFLDVPAR